MVVHFDRLKPYCTTVDTTEGTRQSSRTNTGTASTIGDSTGHSQTDITDKADTNLPPGTNLQVVNGEEQDSDNDDDIEDPLPSLEQTYVFGFGIAW